MEVEQQIFETAWWLLAAITLWWAVGAVLWVGALRGGHAWLHRVVSTIALPGSRRIAQAALTIGMATLPACSPGSEQPTLVYLGEVSTSTTTMPLVPSTTIRTSDTSLAAPFTPSTTLPTTTLPTTSTIAPSTSFASTTPAEDQQSSIEPPPADQAAADSPATEPAATTEAATSALSHRVVPGDHLWGIAAQHLAATGTGAAPTNTEIAQYWRRLITTNAATIRSGDPNLIFPGEVITLPALP